MEEATALGFERHGTATKTVWKERGTLSKNNGFVKANFAYSGHLTEGNKKSRTSREFLVCVDDASHRREECVPGRTVFTGTRVNGRGAGALRLRGDGRGGLGGLGPLARGLELLPERAHLVVDLALDLAGGALEVALHVVRPAQEDRAPPVAEELREAPLAEAAHVLLALLAEGGLEPVGDLAGGDELRVADALVGVDDGGDVAEVGAEEAQLDHQLARLGVEVARLAEQVVPLARDLPLLVRELLSLGDDHLLEHVHGDAPGVAHGDLEVGGLGEESRQLDRPRDALRRLEHVAVLVVAGAERGDHHDRPLVLLRAVAELLRHLLAVGVEVAEELALLRDPAGLDRVRVADEAGVDDRDAEGDDGGLHDGGRSFSRC